MKVADFFCGGGGFSEGFREAGFDVVYAVDKWKPAVDTHHANHPKCNTVNRDVEELSFLECNKFNEEIPDTEILIGSPPCVAFSNSNKSGKADKSLGIRLLEAYLRIVYRKLHKENSILKYWVLENVPNIEKYLKSSYTAEDLGINKSYDVPLDKVLIVKSVSSKIYNSKYYGVASSRRRYICGDFPEPCRTIKDEKDIVPLKKILDNLMVPLENNNNKENNNIMIKDFYNSFRMKRIEITDHHYIQIIPQFQWKKAKIAKIDKGYMGKMSFPENINKPARTVMATMSFSSRESMIFAYGRNNYRAPTIREVASAMSFPLDYKFYGSSLESKYRLVGNAVPPKMSFAIAKEIAKMENQKIPKYKPIHHDNQVGEFRNFNFREIIKKEEKRKSNKARYKYHIPYLIINTCRVELTNHKSDFIKEKYIWDVEIHKGQGSKAQIFAPHIEDINKYLGADIICKLDKYIQDYYIRNLINMGYDELQKNFQLPSNEIGNLICPDKILYDIKKYIEAIMDDNNNNILIDNKNQVPVIIIYGYYILSKLINKIGGR
ncbi:DNA cytosine methyltransferase [Clostridium estertheticum]|uniref:DNA (cytosine-5-)-methyltransferase n=1 Tax=Clostridium estertheticum TaxID=238834 RepID=A0A5N7ILR8_9CLOT|nr:DNA cytosine methyltransferase [Clostridium estertheticum]MPQ31253.1 DNA cytosine methyltransferase [Clostridium estertheticum]MPQ61927.1 DNA cytosine methyltransferase [Clostridium estertheticum]